ncbi:ARM repeat-containing protein [Punctularia strigosozonata HHB-11173 SS5]|uniref:ARM repeat-containing protein n=1 Tax=Punctularia strigosozonata (strain HHB-11173) TaxID=741275 RepID=UPI000441781F|nr:ARM repeat-containing protein [Punctularia strigosozonata HHB-11173 SS5]EIN06364.1 ARM repeat-containing protein [Punctularia strigosozonata HHB-11173 SS5]
MEPVVSPEVTAELTQILSNLVLGDNEIRQNAENAVNERLAQTPELYLLALTQFAISADTEVMRSFSLVLLRRLLFRSSQATPKASGTISTPLSDLSLASTSQSTLYDHLSVNAHNALERLLLHSLAREPALSVRRKTADTVCELANEGMARGRPWHTLQAQVFSMAQASGSDAERDGREVAFRVFAGSVGLIGDLQVETVVGVLTRGLQDSESLEVRHAALRASVSYLSSIPPSDRTQLAQCLGLLHPMLEILPSLPHSQLPKFLATLTPLTSVHPVVFQEHMPALLSFFSALVVPMADAGPTPTVARPFPSKNGNGSPGQDRAFSFDFVTTPGKGKEKAPEDEEKEERDEVRKAALEFMVSLSEAKPAMVKRVSGNGWVVAIVRGCLEGMGELPEDDDMLQAWLDADPAEDPTDDVYPHVYEQALDRLACALGGKSVLPPSFQYIPAMMNSHDWRLRHAGLMAIAALAEGTSKIMVNEVGKVVALVTPMFGDDHPRVRYAACQCVGQLCTDLEEIIQDKYHEQLFGVLIPTLEAPESRVHAHAAAALINFCEGVEHDTLVPYLDPIVERLLKLLHSGNAQTHAKRYVQEQTITTLAMVADASEATFAKHYPAIMPLLLDALRNANGPEYRKLRSKAMECAGLIAIAVGRDVFRPDANAFIELLMRIQNSPVDPGDTMSTHYLIATWAKVCQAMGPEFEPYLPVVMPPLLQAASAKADVSIYEPNVTDEDEGVEQKEGWETIMMDGQQVGIKTSAIEEKCQAFETLVIYCSTLGPRFAPYLSQSLELVLPSLRFFFHDGVREALIPMLMSCGKSSGTLTQQMVAATFTQLVNCISVEPDSSFLASLYKAFADSLRVIGGPAALPHEFHAGIVEATKRQLQSLADRRKARSQRSPAEIEDEKEDFMLLEEMEEFALEDMTKLLKYFDPNHPLLVAVASVRDLGLGLGQWDEDGQADD